MSLPYKGQPITAVEKQSPARKAGLKAGDILLTVNGEQVRDLVDYEALTAFEDLTLSFLRNGEEKIVSVHKEEYDPLGLCFETSLMDRMQTCRNRCVFCFIDQMPRGIRSSLNVKDDDWRMSFIMGNYVSLTNVPEEEFERILKRRVSPLYVSVHAADPVLRIKMMSNPDAGKIMERLCALKEAGIRFHCQAVLCPGLNDGDAFIGTVRALAALRPECESLAAVPVGLTRFREGLFPLRGYSEKEAADLIDTAEALQKEIGEDFLYLSDEWYLMAGRSLPPAESYGDFPQIENGVGLLRLFEQDMFTALEDRKPLSEPKTVTIAGGTAASGFFEDLYKALLPYGITITGIPVENAFFGGNVHVAGLVTGSDLMSALDGRTPENVLIPANMLREREEVFLDGMTLQEAERALKTRLVPFRDAYELIDILWGEEE